LFRVPNNCMLLENMIYLINNLFRVPNKCMLLENTILRK